MRLQRRPAPPDFLYLGAVWRCLLRGIWRRHQRSLPPPPSPPGLPRLRRHDDGRLVCVACRLCVSSCPAACIDVEPMPHPDDPAQRLVKRFVLDGLRCVQCGNCVAACPVEALDMSGSVSRIARRRTALTLEVGESSSP